MLPNCKHRIIAVTYFVMSFVILIIINPYLFQFGHKCVLQDINRLHNYLTEIEQNVKNHLIWNWPLRIHHSIAVKLILLMCSNMAPRAIVGLWSYCPSNPHPLSPINISSHTSICGRFTVGGTVKLRLGSRQDGRNVKETIKCTDLTLCIPLCWGINKGS